MSGPESGLLQHSLAASPATGCLIWQGQDGWIVAAGGLETALPMGAHEDQLAGEVKQLIEHAGLTDRRCLLAVASTECFFAQFPVSAVVDGRDRSAMTFELERIFPLDAEAMVVDYTKNGQGDRFAAIAVETQRFASLIRALDKDGVSIVAIVPTSFLIARGALQWSGKSVGLELVLQQDQLLEWMSLDLDGVWRWRICTDGSMNWLANPASEDQSPLLVVGCDPLPDPLERQLSGRPIQYCSEPLGTLAVSGANEVMAGGWGRWPDLCRGALRPSDPLRAIATPLRWLMWVAVISLIMVALAASYRQSRIEAEIEQTRTEQRDFYQKAFPGRRPPIALLRSVAVEHRKALGSRGKGESVELSIPATAVLDRLYEALGLATRDFEIRFRVTQVDIIEGRCSVTIRVREAVHVGTIAKALEQIGFEVDPPASQQIDPSKEEPIATYESTIVATWPAPSLEDAG